MVSISHGLAGSGVSFLERGLFENCPRFSPGHVFGFLSRESYHGYSGCKFLIRDVICENVTFCDWLLPLRFRTLLRDGPPTPFCIEQQFLLVAEEYSVVWLHLVRSSIRHPVDDWVAFGS